MITHERDAITHIEIVGPIVGAGALNWNIDWAISGSITFIALNVKVLPMRGAIFRIKRVVVERSRGCTFHEAYATEPSSEEGRYKQVCHFVSISE